MNLVSLKDWLIPESPADLSYSPTLADILKKSCAWIDAVHLFPEKSKIQTSSELLGILLTTPMRGCEVHFKDGLYAETGAIGTFLPNFDRALSDQESSLIQLQPNRREAPLVLVHEIGHLIWLNILPELARVTANDSRLNSSMNEIKAAVGALPKFRYLEQIARDTEELYRDLATDEARTLFVDARYEAAMQEWLARIYTFTILAEDEKLLHVWKTTYGQQATTPKHLNHIQRPPVLLHPPEESMNILRELMLYVLKSAKLRK
jgi:hypothetical protein